jgi:hypothetical protein
MFHVSFAAREATKKARESFAFHNDMLLPIPMQADLQLLCARRQSMVDENVRRQNLRRRDHDYSIGDEVLADGL